MNGLLGYCKSIAASQEGQRQLCQYQGYELNRLNEECKSLKTSLAEKQEELVKVQEKLNICRQKETSIGQRQRWKKLKNLETLKRGGLKKRIKAIRYLLVC